MSVWVQDMGADREIAMAVTRRGRVSVLAMAARQMLCHMRVCTRTGASEHAKSRWRGCVMSVCAGTQGRAHAFVQSSVSMTARGQRWSLGGLAGQRRWNATACVATCRNSATWHRVQGVCRQRSGRAAALVMCRGSCRGTLRRRSGATNGNAIGMAVAWLGPSDVGSR